MTLLPSTWTATSLADIVTCQGGTAFSPSLQGKTSGTVPFFKVSDMNLPGNEWFMHRANNYVNDDDKQHINGREKPSGAVVFPKVGAAIHTNKKRLLRSPAFVDNNVMAVWSSDIARCTPWYLYLYFLTKNLSEFSNPGPLPSINNSKIYAQTIVLPPIDEQNRIAALLWKVQCAIEIEDQLLSATEELERSMRHELLTRGLRGEPQQQTEIGLIPQSWLISNLGALGRIGNGSTPRKTNPEYWAGGTYPWLTSAKVYDREITQAENFVTDRALQECHLPRLRAGTVLIAITGQGKTLGHCAVLEIEATINQHIAYIAVDAQMANPSFVRSYLETQYNYLRQVASGGGSTKGALTCAFLRGLKLPLPSIEEQRAIVAILDPINKKLCVHRARKSSLEALFASLLHSLMEGETRVDDLDIDVSEVLTG